jgi:hypothetical protein
MFKYLILATPRTKMRHVKKKRNVDDFTPTIWENYVLHAERPRKESLEAETSVENKEAANPFLISLGGNSGGESDSYDWPLPLVQIL